MSFPGLPKAAAIVITIFLRCAVKGTPQPRLVYPRLVEERAADGAKLVHIHEELTLSLVKASVAARTLIVREFENGTPTVHFVRGEDIDGNLYEDEKQYATVAVRAASDALELEGIVGPRHRIAPALMMERSEEGHLPHLIYDVEEKQGAKFDALFFRKGRATHKRKKQHMLSRNIPEEVTIELFIISDWKHQEHFEDSETLLKYLCVMVNSANLRYKDVVAPRVKLLLTGVERAQETEPYFSGNDTYMEEKETMGNLVKYVKLKKEELGHPDAVYLISGRDLYAMEGDVPYTNLLGAAFATYVCTDDGVAIGEDTPGSYNGMHILTHETAHLLGASHDGEPPLTSFPPGHPGAAECPFNEGHIMTYINNGPNHHRFSSCSVRQIQFVLRLRGPECWKVRSKGHTLDGVYSGMLVKPLDLCKYSSHEADVTVDLVQSISFSFMKT